MTAATESGARPARIAGLRRTVSDLRRSIDFYCGALGFEVDRAAASTRTEGARLLLGEQHIDLVLAVDALHLQAPATALDPRFQHAAIVTADMAAAWRRLESQATIAISRDGPQRLPANTGGVTAFKFRDPDGHPLELIQFPPGVGDPRWQTARTGNPTLGIDHFAIVVVDVDRSLRFFTEQLDLRLASSGLNRGPAQDRLDGLDGVEVDVLSIEPRRGSRTPHLELLHYRLPAPTLTPNIGAPASFDGGDEIVCESEPLARPPPRALRLRDPDGHRFIVDP